MPQNSQASGLEDGREALMVLHPLAQCSKILGHLFWAAKWYPEVRAASEEQLSGGRSVKHWRLSTIKAVCQPCYALGSTGVENLNRRQGILDYSAVLPVTVADVLLRYRLTCCWAQHHG